MNNITANKKITEEKVWMKYYSDQEVNHQLPRCTAYGYLKQCNGDRLDAIALHYYGANITFRELFRHIDTVADAFAAQGVKTGDVVSFLSVQLPETIAAVYALNKIGAIANTIDPRMDIPGIKRMIVDSGSKILVTIDIAFPKVEAILDDIGQDLIITQSAAASLPPVKRLVKTLTTGVDVPYSNTIIKWSAFVESGKNTVAVEAPYAGDATVAITYTGGTTGLPKGVMLTNDSMNAVVMNFMHCDVVREDGDRYLGIIPIFSAYGMVCGMHMPLCLRQTLVPIPKFIPATIGKLVKTYRPNHIISTPAFIELLMQSREVKNMDLSFLRTLASGGDTMNSGMEQKLNAFRKAHNMRYPLAQGYGMSELSAAASFCVNTVYKEGSVGIPALNTTIGIFDPETGEEKNYYEVGEVCVTGPTMMKGYFHAPEETAHIMRKHDDGQIWIHSGDLGYMDADGFLFIKGRTKRMITRFDGHKVFLVNLENLVGKRADVRNVAAIGVNDRFHVHGQYPMLLVELAQGADSAGACKDIFVYCQENLEERGKPVAVLAVDAVPLTPMGKNDYLALEKAYAEFDYTAWIPGC